MFGLIPHRRRSNELQSGFFDEMNRIWSLMDRFFDESLGFSSGYYPIRADVKETENEYIVEAELPGVKKENIQVDVKDNTLTIKVEQKEEINEKRENYIRKERRMGTLCRSFYLDNIKEEGIKAKFNNGVLTITLPKEKPDKIQGRIIEIE